MVVRWFSPARATPAAPEAGRIQTNGTADSDFVPTLQAQIKLAPLSQWGKA
jgi:hypothetical protein